MLEWRILCIRLYINYSFFVSIKKLLTLVLSALGVLHIGTIQTGNNVGGLVAIVVVVFVFAVIIVSVVLITIVGVVFYRRR